MGIYIPNIKLPEKELDGSLVGTTVLLLSNGKALIVGTKEIVDVIVVPDYGRLIDADALDKTLEFIGEAEAQIYGSQSWRFAMKCRQALEDAPTVIPAEPPKEEA